MASGRVLLLHGEPILHYRIPIYNYFLSHFKQEGIHFLVAAPAVQGDCPTPVQFPLCRISVGLGGALRCIVRERPDVVILFSGLRNLFILPLVWILRRTRVRVVYWGHGINLSDKQSHRGLYRFLHRSCHSIILYTGHLKEYVDRDSWHKVFVANNTLCLDSVPDSLSPAERLSVLASHNITTDKNVIFVGRMKARKRVTDLLHAAELVETEGVGVVLVGPDLDHVLPHPLSPRITHIPALYGERLLKLMMACDVYCCPGWIGLNIVDAMACGLPVVTEDSVDHGPEVVYLKDGKNGVLVPKGRADLLAKALDTLLADDVLLRRMGSCARKTYIEEASIDRMFQGFSESIRYVLSECMR